MNNSPKTFYPPKIYSELEISSHSLENCYAGNSYYLSPEWQESEDLLPNFKSDLYVDLGKRLFDITTSLLVILFMLSWLIPVIGLVILLDSQGPIFFVQRRTGRRGVPFPCLKFRTMYHRSVDSTVFKQTQFNDARVTRSGRFLRRTNLDELPQFVNVLLGQMSIIGPRPHAIQHDASYWHSKEYRSRYTIKPGITGLAQTRGLRGEIDKDQKMKHRVKYDLFYANKQSIKLDAAIFFWTIETIFKGDKNAW